MDNTAARYRFYRARSFAIMWFVYAGYYFTRKNYAVAKTGLMETYGLNEMQIAPIGGAFLGLYTVGQFVNGILGDKVGSRVMLSFGMIVSALMSLWFGFTSSAILMILLWATNGYFQATGWSNCVKSMSQWFSVRERGVIMGWYCTCYQIGSAFATLFAAYVLGRWGWRSAFSIPAVVLLIIAAAYIFLHKDTPEKAGLPPIDEYCGEKPENKPESEAGGEGGGTQRDIVLHVLSNPMVWFMGLSYFCLKFVRYSLLMWLPTYMTKELGYAPSTSGILSALPELAGFLGCIFAGYVS
ncbi:MAG: MFS transporter, partial [bacterium]